MKQVKHQCPLLRYFWVASFLFFVLSVTARNSIAQQPFSVQQVTSLLEKKVAESEIQKQVEQYKVSFELTRENVTALTRAGASDQLLKVIEGNLYRDLVITSPKNDEEAGSVLKVYGKSKKVPNKHLWLFAQRKGLSVWWPQGGEIELDEKDEWLQSTFVGQPQDVGFKFEIVAMWVSDSVHKDLIDYLQTSEKTGRYPGIRLPEGSPVARVTVRKTTP
ncbi:MAG: hypothetical protein AUJ04_03370 [Acidobacteria bacterium 13_1_40CM_3_55_6]|nr:MAG: hypothetical protein AUJ04_03370 [Acidobacteria bacterium 13_1_40CM_3_55_6]